ncbi:hypothetical protein ZWY2020_047628 [Hordeum vulgare]|nr:hypothetical protein ZWY2020_047628 [Hordeum vulgare]
MMEAAMEAGDDPAFIAEGTITCIRLAVASNEEIVKAQPMMEEFPVAHPGQLTRNPALGLPLQLGHCDSCGATDLAKCEGMDPSVYDMMKTMLADKVAAAVRSSASAKKVKAELLPSPLGGKKRSLDKAVLRKNPPAAADVCSVPPTGDLGSPQHFTSRLVDDSTERVIAASRPSYTLELEEKLRERRAEITALRKQLEEYNNTVKDTGDKERGGLRDEHQAANKAANRRDAFVLLLLVFLG